MLTLTLFALTLFALIRFERELSEQLDPYPYIDDDSINVADSIPSAGEEISIVGGINVAPAFDSI